MSSVRFYNVVMNQHRRTNLYISLIVAMGLIAGGAAFSSLYRLRDDPLPTLANLYYLASWFQPVPYLLAIVGTIFLRQRPAILPYLLGAIAGCGVYGWWWLEDLRDIRQVENMPVRRNALGNILPDIEGQAGAIGAMLWPWLVLAIIGGAVLIGWSSTRWRTPRPTGPRPNDS